MNVNLPAVPALAAKSHAPRPNFGTLVSALHRGDLEAATAAFSALSASPGATRGPAKAPMDALGTALAAGDLEAARSALKEFQMKRGVVPEPPAPAPDAVSAPSSSTINILV